MGIRIENHAFCYCFLYVVSTLKKHWLVYNPGATPQKVAIWCWHNVIFGLHGRNIQHSKSKFSVNTCKRRWLTMSYFFHMLMFFCLPVFFHVCLHVSFEGKFVPIFKLPVFLFSVVSRLDLSEICGQPGFKFWHIAIIWLCPKLG